MTTTVPSMIHSVGFDFTPIKPERLSEMDEECEITKWLKLESDAIPALPITNAVSSQPSFFSTPAPFQFAIGSSSNANSSNYGPTHVFFQPTNTPLLPSQAPYAQPNVFPTFPHPVQVSAAHPMSNLYSIPPNQITTSQFYHQIFAQLLRHQPDQEDSENGDKKRKNQRPFVRRVRQTRPKVVEAKGAVQCKGRNRKKGIQCRNAALMEYIGPRPIYCAEHIELDPKSLYEKCKSSYQKDPGDGKGCKEVVLKEFGLCYKHFGDYVSELVKKGDHEQISKYMDRVIELLNQLEREACAAKKKDGDLYQRKNKLIPKFQEMKKVIAKALDDVSSRPEITEPLPAIELNANEICSLDVHTDFKPLIVDSINVSDPHGFSLFQAEKLIDSLC